VKGNPMLKKTTFKQRPDAEWDKARTRPKRKGVTVSSLAEPDSRTSRRRQPLPGWVDDRIKWNQER
jgi:hypothetical protein